MRSGKLTPVDSIAVFVDAAGKQEPPIAAEMLRLKTRVQSAYDAYDGGLATDPGLPWTAHERSLLRENWSKVSGGALRGKVLSSTQGICAYCGTTTASQLDHYLPKSLFGEYSIHVPNLIPTCGPCNAHKGQRYKLPSGARRYAHPFLSSLPAASLLRASVVVHPAVAVSFSVNEAVCKAEGVLDIVNQQFEDLHLNALFITESVSYLSDRVGAYEEEFETDGEDGVRLLLERARRSLARSRGAGYWAVALLDALLASSGFCSGGFRSI